MLLRFSTKDGMRRIQCSQEEPLRAVLQRLMPSTPLDTINIRTDRGKPLQSALKLENDTLQQLNLVHGSIVFVEGLKADGSSEIESSSQSAYAPVTSVLPTNNGPKINELHLDTELDLEKGLIARTQSSLCRHGVKGMCEYCSPLPPWDKEYHNAQGIKHISFHSYLKKLNESTNVANAGSYIAPLSEPNFKIDKNCKNGHEPWPRGICSKCQPSAITLQLQEFRMIDHVEFERSELVNDFIEAWRSTGTQRFGYLYGRYSKHDATPLGIKAIVEAIYEPPQHDEADGITMDFDQVLNEMSQIDKLSEQMGILPIGLIFTDLNDAGNGDGSVFCKRHKDSYFLTSLEVIMAARHQIRHPNICKYSEQGTFSSKFVTCVISGNLEGEIDIDSYQVSASAEALVNADMITGSTHPSMAYINDTNNERYVPEIFYSKINEYGLQVKENAKPAFPVEYLLVSLTHGFPKDPHEVKPRLLTVSGFPWANRQAMGYSQDRFELKRYIYECATSADMATLRTRISNFHFLIYMYQSQILSEDEWRLLVSVALSQDDKEGPLLQLVSSAGWQTLILILEQAA